MKNKILVLLLLTGGGAYAQSPLDHYTTSTNTFKEIANSTHQVNNPQDLDFVPGRQNEWWVLNKEANVGSTVLIFDAGLPTQSSQFRRDSHNEHFMARAVAIAFGANNYFVTAQEIQNTAGPGSTFMGPALWSSDTSIYARQHQNNWVPGELLGSHIDMLHQSPYGMGVAHDNANVYWYFDGHNGNICKYDFATPHGVGEDDHSDGKIHRYTDVTVTRKPNVPSHLALDEANKWLYIVNGGANKVMRMKTNTGTVGATLPVPPSGGEPLAEYKAVTGATKEDVVTSGLTSPSGIDYRKDRIVVSDYATGNLYIYNVTTSPATLVGTIVTGGPGVMGVRIDYNNRIWYVNATTNKVMRIENPNVLAIDEITPALSYEVYPNPTSGEVTINLNDLKTGSNAEIRVYDMTGRAVYNTATAGSRTTINTSNWAKGMYSVALIYNGSSTSTRLVVQ